MKWDEIKDQFFTAANRLSSNVEYITKVGQAFEELMKVLYEKDPAGCIELINQDAETVSKIFTVEDPASIPPEAIDQSSRALVQTQQFLFTFLRVASLFNSPGGIPSEFEKYKMPPDSKVH
jgi:hypothetical protein